MRRIALNGDEIGEQAALYPTHFVFQVKHSRISCSSRAQRLYQRHAPTNHRLDFPGIVTVREDTPIAAAGDSDTGLKRLLEDNFLLLSVGASDSQRGTKRHASLFHQTKHLRVSAVAMLNRLYAGHDGAAHALGCGCM